VEKLRSECAINRSGQRRLLKMSIDGARHGATAERHDQKTRGCDSRFALSGDRAAGRESTKRTLTDLGRLFRDNLGRENA
jgi:hypothetical protein